MAVAGWAVAAGKRLRASGITSLAGPHHETATDTIITMPRHRRVLAGKPRRGDLWRAVPCPVRGG